jgi:hypothetical protein
MEKRLHHEVCHSEPELCVVNNLELDLRLDGHCVSLPYQDLPCFIITKEFQKGEFK